MYTDLSNPTLCPNLTQQYYLGQIGQPDTIVLQSTDGSRSWNFTASEGFALRYFTGQFTIQQVQAACRQEFGAEIAPTFVEQLCQTLQELGIIPTDVKSDPSILKGRSSQSPLKPEVQWIAHPEGYWILRNPTNVTFLQVSHADKRIIEDLGRFTSPVLLQHHRLEATHLNRLLQLLAATGMLIGTEPPKPRPRKFTPLSLLFFRIPLFNPDPWLSQHVDQLRWLWTQPMVGVLTIFLIASAIVGVSVQSEILTTGRQLWATQGATLLIPFVLLCGFVVAIHELSHAFTLKHYGGIVPEIGLLLICLSPGCYTNTSDSYCLTKRRQRVLVVGAGVLCQVTLWAIGLWMWLLLTPGTWMKTGSYLLMVAALLTLALNLNPLAKFDGYYLGVALTGINNLRSRSFLLYLNLLKRQPIREAKRDRWILAGYAPLSLVYSILIFGHLLAWVADWSLVHIPALALTLLVGWATYYYFPSSHLNSMTSASPSSSNSRPSINGTEIESSTTHSSKSTPRFRISRGWVVAGTVAIGLGCISIVPIPYTITGDAAINSTPGARQLVSMPEAAMVKAVLVRLNERVQPGQIVAELSSTDLEHQRLDVERRLAEAISERNTAQQQLNLTRSREMEITTRVQTNIQKADRLQRELRQMTLGNESPRIRQLQQQQSERQREIAGWKAQLAIVNAQIAREQDLITAGALPLSHLDEPKRQQVALTSQIESAQAQIRQLDEQIAGAQKEMHEEWNEQRQPDVNAAIASLHSAQQEVAGVQVLIQKWEQQIPLLQAERQQVIERQERLKLKATVSGTVTTPDLDLLVGQKLTEGKDVLTISNAKQPTALIELSQADAYQVKVGMPVTFRLQDGGLQGFEGTVLEIPPTVAPESPQQPQQKPMVKVRIGFADNTPEFTLGTKGYAHVHLGSILLYQKATHEVLKLLPVGKFI